MKAISRAFKRIYSCHTSCHVHLALHWSQLQMADKEIEVLFEFKENRNIICCKPSRICEEAELQISIVSGVDCSPLKVFVLSSSRRRSVPGPYYLLQRWAPKWKCYINIDSVKQIKSDDRLSVVTAAWEKRPRYWIHSIIAICRQRYVVLTSYLWSWL